MFFLEVIGREHAGQLFRLRHGKYRDIQDDQVIHSSSIVESSRVKGTSECGANDSCEISTYLISCRTFI